MQEAFQTENKQNFIYDVAIVGGGINGVAAARDAALRGHKVYLCEKGDLADATSSASSKIAHGGLRYLEQYDFALVRKGLKEREVLLKIAPHLVTFIGFILPHAKHLRPKWLIRLGLFLYDNLFQSAIVRRSRRISLKNNPAGVPLKREYTTGFIYHDGWMDDARIVVMTAKGAEEYGATIAPRTRCTAAQFDGNVWTLTVVPQKGPLEKIYAKTLINAAGPWAETFLQDVGLGAVSKHLTLVKGSHIVVPQLFNHQSAYLMQTEDKRVVFAFPYQKAFTLIGTTDTPFTGDPKTAAADVDEIEYLCNVVNAYFEKPIHLEDVVWHYSGVRPLIDDGGGNASKASRDYSLQMPEDLPLVNIWGGKFTSHRLLAEEVIDRLSTFFWAQPHSITANTPLPGGEMGARNFPKFLKHIKKTYTWLPVTMAERLVYTYGTRVATLLEGCTAIEDLGQHFGADLYQIEVDYLIEEEWAHTADDVLWRRTKLGLHLSLAEQGVLKQYLLEKGDA